MKQSIESIDEAKVRNLSKGAFLTIFVMASLLIPIFQFFRQGNISENYDKAIFILVIVLGFYFSLKKFKPNLKFQTPNLILVILSLITIVIGVISLENHTAISQQYLQKLWRGFGFPVLILCLILIPIIYQIYVWKFLNKLYRVIFFLISMVVIGFLSLAVLQRDNSIMDTYHSEYVINEIYAIPSGNIPYVDFIPQYGIFYSEMIYLFSKLASIQVTINLVLIFISIGTITAILIAIYLVYKSLNSSSLALATLLVVPFTSITKFPGRTDYPGNIFDLISAVPIRILPGLIIGALLVNILNSNEKIMLWKIWLIGIIIGNSFWLNQDFALLAGLIGLFYLFLFGNFKKIIINVTSAAFLGLLFYPLVASQFGQFRFNSVGFFALQYSSGYMAEPIQTPGPVLVILPLIVALFFASTTPLVLERFKRYIVEPEYRRALLTASFFSCWTLIGFAYYLNRSYASGQMQILFLPLSVASASYFYYLFPKVESIPWGFKDFFHKGTWAKSKLKYQIPNLSLAILMALPLASIIAFPNPQIEIERLTNAPAENKWPLPKNQSAFADIDNLLPGFNSTDEVMYFGSSGNYIEMNNGIKNSTIFNSPFDLFMSANMVDIQCNYLKKLSPKYLLVNDTGLAVAQAFPNSTLCGMYSISNEYPSRVLVLNN